MEALERHMYVTEYYKKSQLSLMALRDCSLTLVIDCMKTLFFEVATLFSGHF